MHFLFNGHTIIIKEERGEDQTDNAPSSRSDALMAEQLQETYGKQGEINPLMSAN